MWIPDMFTGNKHTFNDIWSLCKPSFTSSRVEYSTWKNHLLQRQFALLFHDSFYHPYIFRYWLETVKNSPHLSRTATNSDSVFNNELHSIPHCEALHPFHTVIQTTEHGFMKYSWLPVGVPASKTSSWYSFIHIFKRNTTFHWWCDSVNPNAVII